jgi:hypothetical protein
MNAKYEARWISKQRADSVKRSGGLIERMLLDTFRGFIIVEPVGSKMGDGARLSPAEADYELQPTWVTEKTSKLREARTRLGLESGDGPWDRANPDRGYDNWE